MLLSFGLLLILFSVPSKSKALSKNTVFDDDMDPTELIDSFLERAKQSTRRHKNHQILKRHRVLSHHLTSTDAHGREYVKCRKTLPEGGSVMKRCYRPPSDDMRVGCYAVWDMKSETLVQDCWVQQAISMTNCDERKCIADKSSFCCCYGHNCNERFEMNDKSDEQS